MRYALGGWQSIPSEFAPIGLDTSNLSTNGVWTGFEGQHYSKEEVAEMIQRSQLRSDGQMQGKIPRSYEDWHTKYKNSARNERQFGDCRSPRIRPSPVSLPASPVSVDLLETIAYEPEKMLIQDDWGRFVFDQQRESACKSMFAPVDKDDDYMGERFTNDKSGEKRVPYSSRSQRTMGVRQLCDEYIWFITHMEEPGKMVITKTRLDGNLVYRVSLKVPVRINGYTGYIRIPSVRTEAGYLYFEWMDFIDRWDTVQENKKFPSSKNWYIKRIQRMKFREPSE